MYVYTRNANEDLYKKVKCAQEYGTRTGQRTNYIRKKVWEDCSGTTEIYMRPNALLSRGWVGSKLELRSARALALACT